MLIALLREIRVRRSRSHWSENEHDSLSPIRADLRREHRRRFDFGFKRFQRRRNDFVTQLVIQFRRQTGVTAGMWNGHGFYDTACADLLRHRIHCSDYRNRQARAIEFFANHSAAATARPSGRDQQDPFHPVFF